MVIDQFAGYGDDSNVFLSCVDTVQTDRQERHANKRQRLHLGVLSTNIVGMGFGYGQVITWDGLSTM